MLDVIERVASLPFSYVWGADLSGVRLDVLWELPDGNGWIVRTGPMSTLLLDDEDTRAHVLRRACTQLHDETVHRFGWV